MRSRNTALPLHAQRRDGSSNKVDMLIILVMVALFLLTLTITFSPANFPAKGYHESDPTSRFMGSLGGTNDEEEPPVEASPVAKPRVEKKTKQEEKPREEVKPHEEVKPREEVKPHEEVKPREDVKPHEEVKPREEEPLPVDPVEAFEHRMKKEAKDDERHWEKRKTLTATQPTVLGDEWMGDEEAQCSQADCPWKGPYLDGKQFRQENAGCDPRSMQCKCLEHWQGAKQCPKSFPKEKRVTIAVTGWLLDFMGQYVEGDYDCQHSSPHVVNFAHMGEGVNPDIYLSSDVPFITKEWQRMLAKKHEINPDAKMALLYIEAEPHVSHWFSALPELDISLTFYDWADIHITHIQDHPSWFRNAPFPFHQKRNITFINTGCYGHRTAIVEEVMKYLPVENLGNCLKNADYCALFPLCCRTPWHGSFTSRYVEKECLIHHYKFVLALENTVSLNYTTEKFFQPMKMGTIPIYWGSNTSSPLAPGDNAVIRVDDFPSIKHLTDYMKELMEDENKYNKHLEWKWKPFRPEFLKEAAHSLSTFMCRLADAYKQGQTFYGATKMPNYAAKKAAAKFP